MANLLNKAAVSLALMAAVTVAPPVLAAQVAAPGGGSVSVPSGPPVHQAANIGDAPHVYGWRRGHPHGDRYNGDVGIVIGDGYAYGDEDGDYADCEWLHERAVETGSRYWWRRYEDCID